MDLQKQLNGMNAIGTELNDAYIIESKLFQDDRGFFMESFNLQQFQDIVQYPVEFVQDNHSKSSQSVLRGLHYQVKRPQGKLMRCVSGAIYDVAVDLRQSSSTFGKWIGVTLNRPEKQLWVPPGFAHGFYVMSETAEVTYKTTDYYVPDDQETLAWDDSTLNIDWLVTRGPILSAKDQVGKSFEECHKYE